MYEMIFGSGAYMKTSRMADASDGGELQNEPWELLDIDELLAQVPLPDDVIDVRE